MEFSGYYRIIFLLGIISAIVLSSDGYMQRARRRRRNAPALPAAPTSSNTSVVALITNATLVACQSYNSYNSPDGMAHSIVQNGTAGGGSPEFRTTPPWWQQPTPFPRGTPTPAPGFAAGLVPTVAPSVRRVALNTSQMHDMFEHKGGNYLQDYMATTQEEAVKNFPNLLTMTAPQKVSGSNTSLTASDNFLAMQTIVDDLKKLHAYLSTTRSTFTTKNSQTSDKTNSSSTATMDPKYANQMVTKTPASYVKYTGSTTKTVDELGTTVSKQEQSLSTLQSTSTTSEAETPKQHTSLYDIPSLNMNAMKSPFTKSQTASAVPTTPSSKMVTPPPAKTINTPPLGIPVAPEIKIPHSQTPAIQKSSTPEIHTSPASGIPKSPEPEIAQAASLLKAPTADTQKSVKPDLVTSAPEILTTIDPEVSKSLSALDRYLHGGYSGSNESGFLDLDSVWRAANTSIHPAALLELKRSARRRKRQSDGSVSREQYCQLKGSKTDDGFLHLCSTCAVITQLPDDYFPRFINEAVCKTGDSNCFLVNGRPHGQCRQRTITLNIMRKRTNKCLLINQNGEKIITDDWELYPKKIRVSCECLIDKRSAFARFV